MRQQKQSHEAESDCLQTGKMVSVTECHIAPVSQGSSVDESMWWPEKTSALL